MDTLFGTGFQAQTINQDGAGLLRSLGPFCQFLNIDRFASHNDPMKAGLQQTVPDFFPGQAGWRGHAERDQKAAAVRFFFAQLFIHRLSRVALHRLAAFPAVQRPYFGKQELEVVVQFGHGPDG